MPHRWDYLHFAGCAIVGFVVGALLLEGRSSKLPIAYWNGIQVQFSAIHGSKSDHIRIVHNLSDMNRVNRLPCHVD